MDMTFNLFSDLVVKGYLVACLVIVSVLNCEPHQMMRLQHCGCDSGRNDIEPQLQGDPNHRNNRNAMALLP